MITGGDGLTYWTVPCGHCLACRIERSKAWAIRLMLESLSYERSCFVTLTYDDDHIPLTETMTASQSLPYTLYKRDLQLFFKRLRRDLEPRKIRYYAVGEYGDHTFRPHYHVILFGVSYTEADVIRENWTHGIVDVGDVTLASCNYVAGYVQKKLYGDVSKVVYGERLPPFSVMSKGIGKKYLEEHWEQLLDDKYILYRSSHIQIPRYFWKMVVEDDLIPFNAFRLRLLKGDMAKYAKEKVDREYARLGVTDPAQIASFEDIKREQRARTLAFKEKLKSRSKI